MKTRKPMKLRRVKCACGVVFETRGPNAKRCPECAKLFMRLYVKWFKRHDDSALAHASALEEYLSKVGKGARNADELRHNCPYCGTVIVSRSEFCKKCHAYGLDQLHKYNGKTNGWDKRK